MLPQPITVKADDTEDLLNVYGLTLGGPIKSEIEKEMEALERDLLSMQSQQSETEKYNATLKKYIERREEFMDSILNDVQVYQNTNDKISKQIADNILTGDISDLIKMDAQYKTNVSYINELLSAMNNYQVGYDYRSINVNTSDVESRLLETKQLYVESLDTFDLGKVNRIDFVLPSDRVINSPYGYRQDPITRNTIKFHSGVDYRAVTGTPIYALFNGVVISSGFSETIGNFVVVQSGDNVKYMACHCSELAVTDNQSVKQGDVIAYVGGTGTRCTGPHLHLALYLNGSSYDVDRLFK